MIRSASPLRLGFVALLIYLVLIGATYNGVILPEVQFTTLLLLTALIGAWLFVHRWRGWTWFDTPLDPVVVAWGAAILISLLANIPFARNIVMGLWFVGMYLATWYLLTDLLGNRVILRVTLIDAVLVAGFLVMIFACIQIVIGQSPVTGGLFGLIRPTSTLGNPNTLGAFLVVIIGMALGRLMSMTTVNGRLLMGFYLLLVLTLLALTFSRGAWLGGAAAVIAAGLAWLAVYNLLSFANLRKWWLERSSLAKWVLVFGVAVMLVLGVAMTWIILDSLDSPGRSIGLRTYIWDTAWSMFTERPLTGHGLFTFGKGLVRYNSMPPLTPHTHAHNLPLNVLAELGLAGLAALLLSLVVMGIAFRRNWRAANTTERPLLIAGLSAGVGFGVHHLLDLAAMMPLIALSGMIVLVVGLAPVNPQPLTIPWRRAGHPVFVVLLWIALLATGIWSATINREYVTIVQAGLREGDYAQVARDLDTVIARDLGVNTYRWQQAMLYGLDAYVNDDLDSASAGITGFEQSLEIDPQIPALWANVAALHWQRGDRDRAIEAVQEAVAAAPDAWSLQVQLIRYLDQTEDTAAAQSAYIDLVTEELAAAFHPDIYDPLRIAGLPADLKADDAFVLAETLNHLSENEFDAAMQTLDRSEEETTTHLVIRAILAHEAGDDQLALDALANAESHARNINDDRWLLYGQVWVFDGDSQIMDEELTAGLFSADYRSGTNIWQGQYLRNVISRHFLPQVGYTTVDPLLLFARNQLGR